MREQRAGQFPATQLIHRSPHSLSPSFLVLWTNSRSQRLSPLSRNVVREICSYFSACVLLPGVYEGLLYIVNVRSKAYRSVCIADLDLSAATFSQVDSSNALCLLLAEDGYRVYWLDMTSVVLREVVGHMLCWEKPSVCVAAGTLYLFRGKEGCKLGSEKYALGRWSQLGKFFIYSDIRIVFPDRDIIYIGQMAGSSVYYLLFSTTTQELSRVISLSSCFSPSPGSVYTTTDDKQLLCLTEDFDLHLWHWSLFRMQLQRPRKRYAQAPTTKGFALLLGRELYWLDADQPEVHCFHTGRLEWKWCKLKQEQVEESGPSQGNCCVECSPF